MPSQGEFFHSFRGGAQRRVGSWQALWDPGLAFHQARCRRTK